MISVSLHLSLGKKNLVRIIVKKAQYAVMRVKCQKV